MGNYELNQRPQCTLMFSLALLPTLIYLVNKETLAYITVFLF